MSVRALAALEGVGPILSTAEARAVLGITLSSTSRLLRTLERDGRARQIKSGLWAIGSAPIDPFQLPEELTRPHPAYVSFTSALNYHGIIDQLPREVSVASTDRARMIRTSIATYSIHRLPPTLFGGWNETPRGLIAEPEKAIFDFAYVNAAHRAKSRRVPELELPSTFDRGRIDMWLDRIDSQRLRTLTRSGVQATLARATG